MAKNDFLTRIQVQHQIVLDREVNKARRFTKQFVMDVVTLTLGRMGMSPEWLNEFREKYFEVCQDFAETVLTDAKDDKELDYAKECIDRELKMYVDEEHFVPFKERYDQEGINADI